MNCTGMYALGLYIQTVQVCTNCAGIYELYRYVWTVQSCTNCACMYKLCWYVELCRCVQTMQVCTKYAGVYKLCWYIELCRHVQTVQVCTKCGGMYKLCRYVRAAQALVLPLHQELLVRRQHALRGGVSQPIQLLSPWKQRLPVHHWGWPGMCHGSPRPRYNWTRTKSLLSKCDLRMLLSCGIFLFIFFVGGGGGGAVSLPLLCKWVLSGWRRGNVHSLTTQCTSF